MVLDQLTRAGLGPDGPAFWILLAVLIAAVFLIVYSARVSRRAVHLRADLERTRVALSAAETRAEEVPSLKDAVQFASEQNRKLEMESASASVMLAEREKALAELKERMDTEFRAATSQMLEGAHKAFLQRANETFDRHREAASAEADTKRKALDDLIKPMSESLTRYQTGLAEMRAEQQKSRGELVGRIGELAKSTNDVRMEAQKLSSALRAGPKIRGRWGEEQLRNVVEIAGMAAYVDFVEQPSHDDGDRRKQPDMVVNLPGGRKIAVDSKVSINAYLDAAETDNEALRNSHLEKHAEHLWAHVKALSAKDYASSLGDSLDIVIMFVPGENYFAAAMETRPQLFQDAFDRKILIATPTTLVAMLKAASFNWRQEKAAENAKAVADMAKDLYDSLRTMGGHMAALGRSLETAVSKYNSTIGGLERRVMPRARKFAEYELPGLENEIPELKAVETSTAAIRSDKDLLIPPHADDKDAA